jgi:cell division septation protein DedD
MTAMRSRRLGSAVAVALVAVVLAGCGDSSPDNVTTVGTVAAGSADPQPEIFESTVPAPAAQLNLKPGTAATVPTDDGTVRVTVRSLKAQKKACGADYDPPENGVFVIADVLIEVIDGEFSFSGGEFQWLAEDGTVADTTTFTGCTPSPLQGVNGLPAGQKRAGQIVFDVKSKAGSLGFGPDLNAVAVASWRM